MQEERHYAPSTASRRLSTMAGFYRTCVIDGVLEHSPAEYVRRPPVTTLSPTLGLSHLQFEAMLHTARQSPNLNDFALVCVLGLPGLRIMEAAGLDIDDLAEEHGHRVVRVLGKGTKVVLVPRSTAPSRDEPRARSCSTAKAGVCNATQPRGGFVNYRVPPGYGSRGCTRTCSGTLT
jgi:site-specific recombinase XerD